MGKSHKGRQSAAKTNYYKDQFSRTEKNLKRKNKTNKKARVS